MRPRLFRARDDARAAVVEEFETHVAMWRDHLIAQTTDPVTYAAVAAGACLLAVAAALVPARRAARIDPLAAVRDG